MFLNKPAGLSVIELIKAHGSNTYIDFEKFSHVSNINWLNSDVANTSATLHYTEEYGSETFEVIYNRINLSTLFGMVPLMLRSGKVDWRSTNRKEGVHANGKVEKEIKELYGVDLTVGVSISSETFIIYADIDNPTYYGNVHFSFYSDRYNDVPFNTLTGYSLNRFKGDYTLMPTNPYPIDSYLYTKDLDYNPNGEIFGEWLLDNPIITSGEEFELLRLPVAFTFEKLEEFVKRPHIDVICLNKNAVEYNQGNAVLLDKHWKITNPDSPLYNELVSVIHREEMLLPIRTYMLIRKDSGYVSHIDNPKHRWLRVK